MKILNLKMSPVFVGLVLFILTQVTAAAFAQDEVAKLDSAEGTVELRPSGASEFKSVDVGISFHANDTVRTLKNSRAAILFSTGVLLRLAPGTSLQFADPDPSRPLNRKIKLDEGKAHFFERQPSVFPEIETPAVSTAIRGTEFVIEADKDHTEVSILSGRVECYNRYGNAEAGRGEKISTKLGQAPVRGLLVDPVDAVQWTLYYPELVDLSAQSGPAIDSIKSAQRALSSGEISLADQKLQEAGRLISGQAESKHRKQLEALLLAQQSVIATVKSKKDEGLELADRAWIADENASSALAKAYAFQSRLRLDKAREWLAKAEVLNPQSGFIAARQAELELGFGDLEEAEKYSSRALELSPDDAYALSVAGFTALLRIEREQAKDYFERAIAKQAGLGLPRLGLGLALIQQGKLEQGRKLLEQAVALEPTVSVYRSYLGKAFFEEERESEAFVEYEQAIAMDDQDPTPYLYRAFSHLSANRPVAALEDVEKSIELNDARAVYRSSLLLDQDLGVRSASLAEVYNSLGFSQLARVEAIRSLNHDYLNYSAHRLLGDSYNTIYLNDAGISENKIATLLAPLSLNLYGQGSSVSSFNEYNSLFERDQNRYDVGAEFRSDDRLLLPEAKVAGRDEKFGYLLGYDALFTDDDGVGNDSRRHRGRAVLQYQPDYNDFFLLDSNTIYRRADNDREAPDEIDFDDYNFDAGYRHNFSAQTTFLFESTFANQRSRFITHASERDIALARQIDGEIEQIEDVLILDDTSREKVRSHRHTAQIIYDSDAVSLVVGTQFYLAHTKRNELSPVLGDEQGIFDGLGYEFDSQGDNRLHSGDTYLYSTWHLAPWADISAGASYTDLTLDERELTPFLDGEYGRSNLSPKAGLTLYPTDKLTLRSAYFQTLRKSSLEDTASLEPSLVGGLNQRFTDFSGNLAETVGGALDYKASPSTYLGAEAFRRNVSDNLRPAFSGVFLNYDDATAQNDVIQLEPEQQYQDQEILRGYLYQVLFDRMVGTINYEWSSFERDDPDFQQDLTLRKTGIGFRYMDPEGWYLLTEFTYRRQERKGSDFADDGVDGFWITDLALGYRLPQRHGAVELRAGNLFNKDFSYDQSLGLEEFVRDDLTIGVAFTLRDWD